MKRHTGCDELAGTLEYISKILCAPLRGLCG